MSVIDKFLDVMKLGGDEYDDDYDDYDDFDDDYDDKPKKGLFKHKKEDGDSDVEDEPVKNKPQKVTPIRAARRSGNGMEVCVIKPNGFNDSKEVVETLLSNRTVVLNFEGLDVDVAQRIIDFTSGACLAIDGNLQKVSGFIFLATPKSVDISGDLQDILSGSIDIPSVYDKL